MSHTKDKTYRLAWIVAIPLIVCLLLAGCAKPKKPTLGAMDKFFDCLGDSSKCKDIINKEQKENFEEHISRED